MEQHPELLSDEADARLGQLLDAARAVGAQQAAPDDEIQRHIRILEEHRALLRRCREVGVEQAFAEKVGAQGRASLPPELGAILQELARPAGILDMPRRVELCRRGLALTDRTKLPELWAVLQGELGNSLVQNPLGNRAENIEQAIGHYRAALEVRTREAMPVEWARP
ncbi:MAG: hypothetical protein KatS3mg050_3574 [Litorilinea sp.]|nr:MAG: hypothetical protein KatS3mg050_3574 [Litorilinea sp.]